MNPGCTGKKRHATIIAANRAALQAAKKLGAQQIYKCKFCNGFHLTTKTSDITKKTYPRN